MYVCAVVCQCYPFLSFFECLLSLCNALIHPPTCLSPLQLPSCLCVYYVVVCICSVGGVFWCSPNHTSSTYYGLVVGCRCFALGAHLLTAENVCTDPARRRLSHRSASNKMQNRRRHTRSPPGHEKWPQRALQEVKRDKLKQAYWRRATR